MKATVMLHNAQQGHAAMAQAWREYMKPHLIAERKLEVTIREARRTTEQNSKLWAMLNDISAGVDWYGQKLTPEEWKHVFTAALKKQRVVPGLDGGFVVLGLSTSRMSKAELSELIELILAFAAERGVSLEPVGQEA